MCTNQVSTWKGNGLSLFALLFYRFILCLCMFCLHRHLYMPDQKRHDGSPSTGVMDGCELPDGCWKSSRVLWQGSQCSQPLRHLSSPFFASLCCFCVCVIMRMCVCMGVCIHLSASEINMTGLPQSLCHIFQVLESFVFIL